MNAPHRIRLHGPWDYEIVAVVSQTSDVARGDLGRFQLPDGWTDTLGEDFIGTVRLTRRFNCPTGLGANERVWLVIEGGDNLVDVRLNDHALRCLGADDRSSKFDITERLSDHNRLTLEVTRTEPTGPLVASVHLEIRNS